MKKILQPAPATRYRLLLNCYCLFCGLARIVLVSIKDAWFKKLSTRFSTSITTLVALLCLLVSPGAVAQQIAVPKGLSANDSSLYKGVVTMARQIIPLYHDKNTTDSLENIFSYQLAAEQYMDAVKSLDTTDVFYGDTGITLGVSGIQFRSFAFTKQAQLTSSKSFAALYPDTLLALYNRFPETIRGYATSFFYGDTAALKNSLTDLLAKAAGKDSIDIAAAGMLVRTYNFWYVYSHVLPLAKPLFIAEDNKLYNTQDNVLISMPDGGKLSATIVRRRKDSLPMPVIVRYNIYSDTVGAGFQASRAQEAAAKGYASVILNTRGKKGSPQAIEPFEHDAQDAYYALDWISKQPWSNGKIGMYGGSYLGFAQWSATKKLHPALKTIVPQVAVGIGIDYPGHNGIFMSYMLQWIHYVSNNKGSDRQEFRSGRWDSLFRKWYKSGTSFRSIDSMDGRPNVLFQRWLNHPQHDAYWKNMVPYGKEFASINIPVLTTTGYYDDDQRGAFYYMQEHLKWNKKAQHYLLIGPWDHGSAQSSAPPKINGYTLDKVAVMDINETVFKWFDHILKDSALPPVLKDKVNFQVAGANEWRSAPSLKEASNDSLLFYLSNVRSKHGYKLVRKKPAAAAAIAQEISYTDRQAIPSATADGFDEFTVDTALYTEDNLVFVSEPLQEDMIMNGSMEGAVTFTINKKDVDLNIRLYQQLPDSSYFSLSHTIFRASYIKDRSRRQLLQPGKQQTIAINNAYYMCRKMVKGSRIVVVAGMQKSPNWQVNYGTGKDVSDETIADGQVPLEIEWSNNSYIKIPLLR